MAQDPYGFPEAAGGGTLTVAGTVHPEASQALWFGAISAICAAVGLCACYVPFFIGAPMGAYAAYKGMTSMNAMTDARDRAMATAGMVTGILGGLVSGLWAAFILLYVCFFIMYFVVIFLVVGIGAATGAH